MAKELRGTAGAAAAEREAGVQLLRGAS